MPRPDAFAVSKALEELGADRPLFEMRFGKCASANRYLEGRYFRVGADMDPSEFVSFTRRQVRLPAAARDAPPDGGASGSRISVVRDELAGADGTIASPTEQLRDENFRRTAR
jgi:hypothetical protein